MTVTVSPVALLNGADNKPVDAELWDAITDKQLADWEGAWTPELFSVLKKLQQAGVPLNQWPQERHWDWRKKAKSFQQYLSFPCVSLMCDKMTQGMMILDTTTKRCLIPAQAGRHLAYVEYVEAAPWNRRDLGFNPPRYKGVGSLMLRAAIEYSKDCEFEGRIGLHSLPQADDFYSKIGMTDLGHGHGNYPKLRYFEMTTEQVEGFIQKGGQT